MATKAQQQQLLDTLKFTPRTYRITMWGYGGEKVMGVVDPKSWDYCVKNRVNLQDLAWGYDYCEDTGLDQDQLPFTPGAWYECDSMGHAHGVSRSAGWICIDDENGETVFEKNFDDCDGAEDSPQWCGREEAWIGSRQKGEVVFIGSSNEKGTFFEGDIELTAPFDISKLDLWYEDIDGEELVNEAHYNGEEIENVGGSTDGKSSDMDLVRLTDDAGNWERYEVPEENDLPHQTGTDDPIDFPKSACDSKTWDDKDKTDWYPVKIKPVHPGNYECQFRKLPAWPWPAVQTVTWTGKSWVGDDGYAVKDIREWRGLQEKVQ